MTWEENICKKMISNVHLFIYLFCYEKATAIEDDYISVPPTVNTDTETAVVNVRYATRDQARL